MKCDSGSHKLTFPVDSDPYVAIVGAGGHSKVVIGTLEAAGWLISAVYDDNPKTWGASVLGHPVVGPISQLHGKPGTQCVIAIGNPAVRAKLAAELSLQWVTAIHPAAWVHESAKIAPGAVVFAGAVIQPDVVVGEHAVINTGATVDHDGVIGAFANVGPGAHLAGNVCIGVRADLGTGCSVIPSIHIGNDSILGAGSVVVSNIPERVVAFGCPARVARAITNDQSPRLYHTA